jgi:ketosteroid isomerase-like protein
MHRAMNRVSRVVAVALLVMPALGVVASRANQAPEINTLTEQVRAAETAFAKTMADRNHDAFATFIADEAIFFGREGEIRGKAAVVEAWKELFNGKVAPFSWRPETAVVLDSGTLGLTSGPVFDPQGKQTGTFQSVWRRTSEGRWQIIFDKGCPYCGEEKK